LPLDTIRPSLKYTPIWKLEAAQMPVLPEGALHAACTHNWADREARDHTIKNGCIRIKTARDMKARAIEEDAEKQDGYER
jgi:hypothetical protein